MPNGMTTVGHCRQRSLFPRKEVKRLTLTRYHQIEQRIKKEESGPRQQTSNRCPAKAATTAALAPADGRRLSTEVRREAEGLPADADTYRRFRLMREEAEREKRPCPMR
jgi:hypothetical protein